MAKRRRTLHDGGYPKAVRSRASEHTCVVKNSVNCKRPEAHDLRKRQAHRQAQSLNEDRVSVLGKHPT
jgi:hypothetical protein